MTDTVKTQMGLAEWGMLTVLSMVWGGSFFFVGTVVDDLRPFTIVAVRLALAAPALWIAVLVSGNALPRAASVWLSFLLMGAINNALPFSLLVYGQTQIASGVASILNATLPIFMVIVAGFVLPDERATPAKVAGVVLGVIGVAVMIGPEVLLEGRDTSLPKVACLGAAFSYACANAFGRRFRRLGVAPVVVAAGQVTAAALLLAPLALIVDDPFAGPMPGADVWAALAALALLSTAFAYILFFRVLASAGARNLSLVTLLVPVFAILLGWVFLGERLNAGHYAGLALIACGLLAIDGRLLRLVRRPRDPARP